MIPVAALWCCTKIKKAGPVMGHRPLNWWAILGSNQ